MIVLSCDPDLIKNLKELETIWEEGTASAIEWIFRQRG